MDEKLQAAVRAVQERFGADVQEQAGEVSLLVKPDQIVEVCGLLRSDFGFNMLVNETAVDYWPAETPRFHVIYHLHAVPGSNRISLRVPLDGNNPQLPSVIPIFPAANWCERELWDMFGIRFQGHPDLRRILMPSDWEGFPLRKDFPLGYEEVQFTFNIGDVAVHKPRPKD